MWFGSPNNNVGLPTTSLHNNLLNTALEAERFLEANGHAEEAAAAPKGEAARVKKPALVAA